MYRELAVLVLIAVFVEAHHTGKVHKHEGEVLETDCEDEGGSCQTSEACLSSKFNVIIEELSGFCSGGSVCCIKNTWNECEEMAQGWCRSKRSCNADPDGKEDVQMTELCPWSSVCCRSEYPHWKSPCGSDAGMCRTERGCRVLKGDIDIDMSGDCPGEKVCCTGVQRMDEIEP